MNSRNGDRNEEMSGNEFSPPLTRAKNKGREAKEPLRQKYKKNVEDFGELFARTVLPPLPNPLALASHV